ncbi:MAG: hypothetical protein M1415_02360 [Firmicutes bacterium]|jgi:hypothetical protein|nr:hypothetical protein [Bacillota bacterium]
MAQDSSDPAISPVVSLTGQRYSTRAQATATVEQLPGDLRAIPKMAQRVTILPHVPGWKWFVTYHAPNGHVQKIGYVAWYERGWLLVTTPVGPGSHLISDGVLVGGLIWTAQTLIPHVTAAMPGQAGTVNIEPTGDGTHVSASWQVGRIVYTVTANRGISTALSTTGSTRRFIQ